MVTYFPRSRDRELYIRRRHLEGKTCPGCKGENIAEYPSLKVTGWAIVHKCQDCFHELDSRPTLSTLGTQYIPWSSLLPDEDTTDRDE